MSLFSFVALVLFGFNSWSQQSYISIGEAKGKKSNLAFPAFNMSGKSSTIATDIYETSKQDLELSNYFSLISNNAYLEDPAKTAIKPAPASGGFTYEPLKTIGAEFLIRGAYSVSGDELTVETFLYHIPQQKMIIGKRYKATASQARKIGHTLANDVLEALTGVRGPFMSKIVATSNRASGPNSPIKEVVTMNWDGTDLTTITNHRNNAISPAWSPDGKKVLYSVFTTFIRKVGGPLTNVSLYVHNTTNGKRTLVSYRPGVNSGGIFSKDGNFIYLGMSKGTGATDLYKINASTGGIVNQLTKGPAGAINVEPSLSPDGKKIVFSSDRGGRPMIYTMNEDGSNISRLTFDGVYNSSPSWSPDGKKIAFAGQSNNNFDIFVMNADGSGIIRVTSAKKANGRMAHNEDPSFSPDSRYVVYTSNRTGKNQIYISTADGAEERRVTNDNYNYYKPKWSENLE